MNLIRRKRGTPSPKEVENFWNLIKASLVATGAAGAIAHPASGLLSIGAEAINQVQSYMANRRSQEFAEDVAEDLYAANQARLLTVEQIQQALSSEQFSSALLQARLIATRTHEEEKLNALRNAVFHVAIGNAPSDDRQAIFLSLIENLTPAHLRTLKFFDEPKGAIPRTTISEALELAKQHVPNLKALDGSAIQFIFETLQRDGLLSVTTVSGDYERLIAPHRRWTSNWGHEFLVFITAPKELENAK